MDRLSYLANKARYPKPKCIGWRVKQGQQTLFESKEYGLCMHYITVHGLKLTPQQIFNIMELQIGQRIDIYEVFNTDNSENLPNGCVRPGRKDKHDESVYVKTYYSYVPEAYMRTKERVEEIGEYEDMAEIKKIGTMIIKSIK